VSTTRQILAQSHRAHDQPAQELTPLDIRFGKMIEVSGAFVLFAAIRDGFKFVHMA